MIPAPTKSALRKFIAWRDSMYRKWKGAPGKTVQPKNPHRVEGGRKAAETRRRNKEIAAALEKWDATIAAAEQDAQTVEVTP